VSQVAGEPDRGNAWVYVMSSWSRKPVVTAPTVRQGSRFGASVAVSDDGAWLLSGTPRDSSAGAGVTGDPQTVGLASSGGAWLLTRP
jgi:hypothetical protein